MHKAAIEKINAFSTVASASAAIVGVIVAAVALLRPEFLQRQKDLQALASARNLAFFAHRENLAEFRLAATGDHISDSATRFETVVVGLQAIKFEQIPPHLIESFVNIWSQTRRAQQLSKGNGATPINTNDELRYAPSFLRNIDDELTRLGASFDAECKAVTDRISTAKNGCAQFR
jgi:hypothetical protein